MSSKTVTLVGVPAIAVAIAAFPWLPGAPAVTSSRLLIGTSALFLLTAFAIPRASLSARQLAVLLALLFSVRATFLFVPPIGSEDLYRYIWDGKVQAAGINPYRYATNALELTPLHGEIQSRLPNREDIKTPYFPFAQVVFRLAYALSGEAVWGIKVLLLLAEAAAVGGLILLLRHLRRPPGRRPPLRRCAHDDLPVRHRRPRGRARLPVPRVRPAAGTAAAADRLAWCCWRCRCR